MENFKKDFHRRQHIRYLKQFLKMLPKRLSSQDSTRMTIAFFAISGLDVLGALDEIIDMKDDICNWVYRQQLLPTSPDSDMKNCGFQGTDTFTMLKDGREVPCNEKFSHGHLAHTYTALAILVILGDDLSRVNREAVLKGVAALQLDDGSFCATLGSENDMRFVYCAACVCFILQDWSGMNVEKTVQFIKKSMSYDYGFGQGPELESHGGVTFCAVAVLTLLGKLHTELTEKQYEGLRRWAIMRQESGFQGRANKTVDSCYSFWVGATLKMLDFFDKVNYEENRIYLLTTEDNVIGGFSKWVDVMADPLHTYLAICGLSLMGEKGLLEINPALNISKRAADHLKDIHDGWK